MSFVIAACPPRELAAAGHRVWQEQPPGVQILRRIAPAPVGNPWLSHPGGKATSQAFSLPTPGSSPDASSSSGPAAPMGSSPAGTGVRPGAPRHAPPPSSCNRGPARLS